MSLGPVVACSRLSKDKVVWPEHLAVGSAPDTVHGAGLQVDEDGPGDVLPPGGLIVVHVDALELEVRVPIVRSGGVYTVLVGNDLPELERKLE